MKNKLLLLFLLICFIVAPCIAKKTNAQKVDGKTAPTPKSIALNINARILIASKTADNKKIDNSSLTKSEKDLTSYLDYNDYKLLKSGNQTTKLNSTYTINFSNGRSVTITPVKYENGKIKAKVIWNIPGKSVWKKSLNFKKGKRSIISGPKDKNGMYLMSLEIN